jgi:hypothetical protein
MYKSVSILILRMLHYSGRAPMKKSVLVGIGLAMLVTKFTLGGILEGAALELPVTGRVLEACSCAVPCTCNFGQLPSPHEFCESLAVFEFTAGDVEGVNLKGLRMAMSSDRHGQNIVYVDSASPEKAREVITTIARWILSLEGKDASRFLNTPIDLSLQDPGMTASLLEGQTRISARPLVGNDGKSPVIVSQPIIFGRFPITRSRKAVATHLLVRFAKSSFEYSNTNANDALFEFLPSEIESSGSLGLATPQKKE